MWRFIFGERGERGHVLCAEAVDVEAVALLVYVACQGRHLTREWLAEFFWPERPHETSLVNLRVALHRLRKRFAPFFLVTRQSVSLRDDNLPYVDGADFERLLGQAQLREALGLYHGDFLSGFHVSGSPAFEAWASAERERLHDLALAAYQELTRQHAARGQAGEAIRLARGLLQLEPYHEPTQSRGPAADRGTCRTHATIVAWPPCPPATSGTAPGSCSTASRPART